MSWVKAYLELIGTLFFLLFYVLFIWLSSIYLSLYLGVWTWGYMFLVTLPFLIFCNYIYENRKEEYYKLMASPSRKTWDVKEKVKDYVKKLEQKEDKE